MKNAVFLCTLMLLAVSPAFAGGIDLTMNACPGNVGAVGGDTGPLDCATGSLIMVLGTFAPNEAIPDLVSLDATLGMQVSPNLDAADFWNVDPVGCGSVGFSGSAVRPASGCSTPVNYTNAWSSGGAGSVTVACRRDLSLANIAITCFRTAPLSVSANQKIFGFQLIFDTSLATESGGSCNGCLQPVCLVWNSGQPQSAGTFIPSELTTSTGGGRASATGLASITAAASARRRR